MLLQLTDCCSLFLKVLFKQQNNISSSPEGPKIGLSEMSIYRDIRNESSVHYDHHTQWENLAPKIAGLPFDHDL